MSTAVLNVLEQLPMESTSSAEAIDDSAQHHTEPEIIIIDEDNEPAAEVPTVAIDSTPQETTSNANAESSTAMDELDRSIEAVVGAKPKVAHTPALNVEPVAEPCTNGDSTLDSISTESINSTSDAKSPAMEPAKDEQKLEQLAKDSSFSSASTTSSSTFPVIKQWKKHASTYCNGYEMMLDGKTTGTERRNWYCPWSLYCGGRAVSEGLLAPLKETSAHNHPQEIAPKGAPPKAPNFGICNGYHMIRGSPHIGSNGKLYWRCRWRPCGARAISEPGCPTLVESRPHNHSADEKPPLVDRSPNGRGSLLELQQQQPLEQLKENCSLTGLASSLDNLIEAARQQPPSDPTLSNSTTSSSSAASTPDAGGGGGRSGLSILQRAAELTTCAPLFAADSPQSPASTSQSSRSTTATPHEPVWRRAHSVDNDSAGGAVASRRRGRPMKRKSVPEMQGVCNGYAMIACGFTPQDQRMWECRHKTAYDCYGKAASKAGSASLIELEPHNHRPLGHAKRVPTKQRFIIVSSSDEDDEEGGDEESQQEPSSTVMEERAAKVKQSNVAPGPARRPPMHSKKMKKRGGRRKASLGQSAKKSSESTSPAEESGTINVDEIDVDATEAQSKATNCSPGGRPLDPKHEEEDSIEQMDDGDEEEEQETAMSPGVLIDILRGLDRGSLESLSLTCAGLRDFVEAKSPELALRILQFARLVRKGNTEHATVKPALAQTEASPSDSNERRFESQHGVADWFFRAIRFAAVEKIEISNVRAKKDFMQALRQYGSAVNVRHLLYERVTDGGISLSDLFTAFNHVGTVDLRRSIALLPITNDVTVRQFCAKDFATLFLPRGVGQNYQCPVTEDALIQFCYNKWEHTSRKLRTLNVYAPQVSSKFVHRLVERGILEKHFGKLSGPPVALNVYFPVVAQDLSAYEQNKTTKKDGSYVLKFTGMQVTWSIPLRCMQFRWTSEVPSGVLEVKTEPEDESRKRRKSSGAGSKNSAPLPTLLT